MAFSQDRTADSVMLEVEVYFNRTQPTRLVCGSRKEGNGEEEERPMEGLVWFVLVRNQIRPTVNELVEKRDCDRSGHFTRRNHICISSILTTSAPSGSLKNKNNHMTSHFIHYFLCSWVMSQHEV